VTMPAPTFERPVAEQPENVRTEFMTRVYVKLMVGIAAFIGVEYLLFASGLAEIIAGIVFGTNWLIILGGFMVVSWMATSLTRGARSPGAAYGGYALLIVANALLFAGPLFYAATIPELEGTITLAAQISLFAFAVLSFIAIRTSKDFTFLRPLLMWGGFLALALIVGSVLFGATLGIWFPIAMIGFAGAAILYDTQVVYRSYPPSHDVQAAMSLFSSIALLFWYVLQLLMRR
jgi:uncharacterized protein